jgi:hypothetical protein
MIDAPYLNLTPGTRLGVIQDEALARLVGELAPLEAKLVGIIEAQQRAEEDRASRDVLRSVQGALKEALLALPAEEYDWFDLRRGEGKRRLPPAAGESYDAGDAGDAGGNGTTAGAGAPMAAEEPVEAATADDAQRQFFEFAGPLFSAVISPTSSVVEVGGKRSLRVVSRDRARRTVDTGLERRWRITEGEGTLDPLDGEIATLHASNEPGLTRISVTVTQGEIVCTAEAQITVTASLVSKSGAGESTYQGLPGYTYHRAAGELWRSRFDADRNLVVINSGHRDFVYASRNRTLKLRYICRLFAKQLVLKNFIGVPPDQLLERLLELTLYTEENLR